MPRYKLMFQDATWQDRRFISLTKIKDDGSARVLNCVMSDQVSFGTYSPAVITRGSEYTHNQTYMTSDMMGSPIADEEFFTHLLGEDILERVLRDKGFLKKFEELERRCNHPVLIEAATDLHKGICRPSIGRIGSTYYPEDYRAYVIHHYINYLLNRDGMRINADPEGLFTEIHVSDQGSFNIKHGGLNDLPVTKENALEIRKRMEALIATESPPYPIIFRYLFVGQPVEGEDLGRYLEITDPTAEQKQIIDSLFDLAAEKGFFPDDSKAIIRKAWEANCRRMSPQATLSSWSLGSPTLLSSPVKTPMQDDRMPTATDEQLFDIRFDVGKSNL